MLDDELDAEFAKLLTLDSVDVDDAYQNVAAEMRGVGRCARAYFRTLLAGPFDRAEAFTLVRDWHHSYWDAQHDALRR